MMTTINEQTYNLVLQYNPSNYQKLLTEEFKKDLSGNSELSPAALFQKYGSHIVTSVSMGGQIDFRYTMSSVEQKYNSLISESIKLSLKGSASGWGASGSVSGGFEESMSDELKEARKNVTTYTKSITIGGDTFSFLNETAVQKYHGAWQKSLLTKPAVMGIKDSNSLYPIWSLVEDGNRQAEIEEYFLRYGQESYSSILREYGETAPIFPEKVTNVRIDDVAVNTNQVIVLESGKNYKVKFDLLPAKNSEGLFTRNYSIKKGSHIAKIDSSGNLMLSNDVKNPGESIEVEVRAGLAKITLKIYVEKVYTVIFNDGIKVTEINGIKAGNVISKPVLNSREGYKFIHWYFHKETLKEDGTTTFEETEYDFNTNIDKDYTIYAKWEVVESEDININLYEDETGIVTKTLTIKSNMVGYVLENPTQREGYMFKGWSTHKDYLTATTIITEITRPKKDLYIYAHWTKLVNVIFELNSGSDWVDNKPENLIWYTPGFKLTNNEFKIPMRQNYEFMGWYYINTIGETIKLNLGSAIPFEDIVVSAKWEKALVRVKYFFNVEGVLVNSSTNEFNLPLYVQAGNEYNLRSYQKSGLEFIGWYKNENMTGKINNTLTILEGSTIVEDGVLVVRVYGFFDKELTYNVLGLNVEEIKQIDKFIPTLASNENGIVELKNIELRGFNFLGWYDGNTKINSLESISFNNNQLRLIFEIITYTIDYECNIEEIKFDLPKNYTVRDNFKFDGEYLESKSYGDYSILGLFWGERLDMESFDDFRYQNDYNDVFFGPGNFAEDGFTYPSIQSLSGKTGCAITLIIMAESKGYSGESIETKKGDKLVLNEVILMGISYKVKEIKHHFEVFEVNGLEINIDLDNCLEFITVLLENGKVTFVAIINA